MFFFVSIHVDAAGNPVCDEFHAGEGFVNNHIFMSNYVEQSLQLVRHDAANKIVTAHFIWPRVRRIWWINVTLLQ